MTERMPITAINMTSSASVKPRSACWGGKGQVRSACMVFMEFHGSVAAREVPREPGERTAISTGC